MWVEWQKNIEQLENKEVSSEQIKKLEEVEKTDGKDLSKNLDNQYNSETLKIDKVDHSPITKTKESSYDFSDGYTKPLLSIKWMDWNESKIPEENREQIVNAINSLEEFQKVRIKWSTDANPITTEEWIQKNKQDFEETLKRFVAAWWESISYDKLLQSKDDPQNTILWYRRAMEWVLSLNLTPDQMKKITISNALWTIRDQEEWKKERGFDIDVDYSWQIKNTLEWTTTDFFYDILWELDMEWFWRYNKYQKGYWYEMHDINLSTHLDPDNPTDLYKRVMSHIPPVLVGDASTEEKIKTQVNSYLRSLINICWWEYNNWLWSAKAISNKQFYTIAATHDKLITKDEFKSIIEKKDISVLENKKLESGKTIKELLEENKDDPITWVGNETSWIYRYYTKDAKKYPTERKISKNDYILLGLYFQTKNS